MSFNITRRQITQALAGFVAIHLRTSVDGASQFFHERTDILKSVVFILWSSKSRNGPAIEAMGCGVDRAVVWDFPIATNDLSGSKVTGARE